MKEFDIYSERPVNVPICTLLLCVIWTSASLLFVYLIDPCCNSCRSYY